MKKSLLQWLCLLVFANLITSCALFKAPPPPPDDLSVAWEEHQEQLSSLSKWELTGRLGISTSENGGGSVSFRWYQYDTERYSLFITGPFGQGGLQLEAIPGQVTLTTAAGEEIISDNATELLMLYTGWAIPIEHLHYWVRGLPTPSAPYTVSLDIYGRIALLNQEEWFLMYPRYQTTSGYTLPQRITLRTTDLEIRALLRQWQPSDDR